MVYPKIDFMGNLFNVNRRKFLELLSISAVGLPLSFSAKSVSGRTLSQAKSSASYGNLRIEDIEIHEISPSFHDYNGLWLARYYGTDIHYRAIYILRMENGLVGYGEAWRSAPEEENFSRFIGTNLYDLLNNSVPTPINMAIYDILGKSLGLPVWKLIGPKIRSWVPVASWTAAQPPEAMANEVVNVAKQGYRWIKYHPDVLQNVIKQTEAMQKVAPPGFKVHYDFNGYSSLEKMYPMLEELEKFPIAGRIEDPIDAYDLDGYRVLRDKCSIPIVKHRGPSEEALLAKCSDGIIIASSIEQDRKLNFLADLVNTPFLFQHVGGGITQAYMAHKAAVFTMADLDHLTASNIWTDDVIKENIEVVNGQIQVLNKPGLGVTLDEKKLKKYSTNRMTPRQNRFLVRVRYEEGPTLYFRHDANVEGGHQKFLAIRHGEYFTSPTLRQNLPPHDVPGTISGYNNNVITDFWAEDSRTFEEIWSRTEESGSFWVE